MYHAALYHLCVGFSIVVIIMIGNIIIMTHTRAAWYGQTIDEVVM